MVHERGVGGGGGEEGRGGQTHDASGPRPDGSARVPDLDQVRQY